MKKIKYLGFIVIVFLLNSCQTACTNNLIKYKIPFSNGSKITYRNQNDSIITYTVQISETDPGTTQWGDGDKVHYKCSALKTMQIGDFMLEFRQEDNWSNNVVSIALGFDKLWYKKIDTIDYTYKNNVVKAFVYIVDTSSSAYKNYQKTDSIDLYGKYYYGFYFSPDYRLLQYTIKNKGSLEKWNLQN